MDAQILEALFAKISTCIAGKPQLQALQDICTRTLENYFPQTTGADITYVMHTPAVMQSKLMEVRLGAWGWKRRS